LEAEHTVFKKEVEDAFAKVHLSYEEIHKRLELHKKGLDKFSLGAKAHLSRGYMVIKLWVFKHFAQHETTGYMLSYFTKKTPL